MNFRALTSKHVVLPLAALYLLLSVGGAVVQKCHTDVAAVIHTHLDGSHHAAHTDSAPGSANTSSDSSPSVGYEVCFAVSFIVLLLIHFFKLRTDISNFRVVKLIKQRIARLVQLPLGYLSVNHLKLGIIRI